MYNNNNNESINQVFDQTLITTIMNNKRHRSAAKSFKSPPQPKFCIRESLASDGRDVFINVLSYSRIANQLSEFDPVPLYGGMLIRSSSSFKNPLQHMQQPPQSPPPQLIFAVMASPEVLKKAGRNCLECPEQLNLVELMCEFVEAMNPGLVLSKKPQILKDRDLQGELKDIWSAVQNFRDKEKAGASDIIVLSEFGPDSAASSSPSQNLLEPSDNSQAADNDRIDANASLIEDKKISNELDSIENLNLHENNSSHHQDDLTLDKNDSGLEIEKPILIDTEQDLVDNKDTGSSKKQNSCNKLSNENESSEKLVKAQNQKNKESHNFFPKFLTSNKDKDKDAKEKEKSNEELDAKVKTKKGLNFFRRNKTSSSSSSTGSPTHNNSTASQHNKS